MNIRDSRTLLHLGAGIAGFVLGSVLTAHPIARVFSPTTVSWDAASCPAGDYTVTSQARRLGSHEAYLSAPVDVTLPQPSVLQEFPDLPPGVYAVSAKVRSSDGQTLGSGVQTITVTGEGQSFAAQPTISNRGRQLPSVEPAGPARRGRDTSLPASTAPQEQPLPLSAHNTTTGKTAALSTAWISVSDLEQIVIRFGDAADPTGASAWRRMTLVDSDADGLTDAVIIETVAGDALLFTVRR